MKLGSGDLNRTRSVRKGHVGINPRKAITVLPLLISGVRALPASQEGRSTTDISLPSGGVSHGEAFLSPQPLMKKSFADDLRDDPMDDELDVKVDIQKLSDRHFKIQMGNETTESTPLTKGQGKNPEEHCMIDVLTDPQNASKVTIECDTLNASVQSLGQEKLGKEIFQVDFKEGDQSAKYEVETLKQGDQFVVTGIKTDKYHHQLRSDEMKELFGWPLAASAGVSALGFGLHHWREAGFKAGTTAYLAGIFAAPLTGTIRGIQLGEKGARLSGGDADTTIAGLGAGLGEGIVTASVVGVAYLILKGRQKAAQENRRRQAQEQAGTELTNQPRNA